MLSSLVAFLIDFYSASLTEKVNLHHYGYGIDEIIHWMRSLVARLRLFIIWVP